jgi:hypothetical protein
MLFAVVLYFILTSKTIITVYDPFTILGISPVRPFYYLYRSK